MLTLQLFYRIFIYFSSHLDMSKYIISCDWRVYGVYKDVF